MALGCSSAASRVTQPRHSAASAAGGPAGRAPLPRPLGPSQPRGRPLRVIASAKKAATGTSLREMLSGSDADALDATMELVESIGFSEEEAETILERSFGWFKPSQSFWRGEVVEAVPSESQVSAVIDYMAELGIKGADLKKYVDKFPHVFGCDVEGLLRANVADLEKTWKIKGPTLAATLKRRPEILGYNLDCLGDCKGECNRCWVRF